MPRGPFSTLDPVFHVSSSCAQDVQRSVFTMLTPVFKRHVQLARQEAAKAFNTDVGEDLEVTAMVMNDINAAKVRPSNLTHVPTMATPSAP
jgi:hypothetical protein